VNGHHTHPGPAAAVHGMLIVGVGPIFLSHLPMFHVPHDHQLIVEIEFDGPGNPRAAYIGDRAASGEPVYTWEPQPFVLTDLLDPARAPEMHGTIFRGHFERDGTPITGADVRARVTRVLHALPLSAAGPRDTALRYIVFGPPSGQFAAHIISGPPDFDHVIAVDVVPPPNTATTVVVSGRSNQPDQRLREGDRVAVAGIAGAATTLEGRTELYLELGDLRQ
jgi:hypothetical protein